MINTVPHAKIIGEPISFYHYRNTSAIATPTGLTESLANSYSTASATDSTHSKHHKHHKSAAMIPLLPLLPTHKLSHENVNAPHIYWNREIESRAHGKKGKKDKKRKHRKVSSC